MAETGAIPKVTVPRRRIRRPLSEISNLQSNEGFLLSARLANNSTGRNNVRSRLLDAKKILEGLRKQVDQMKTTISEIENMDPADIHPTGTCQRNVRKFNGKKKVRFQADAKFPEKEIREVEKEIKEQEMRISRLKTEFSNKTSSRMTSVSSEPLLTEISNSAGTAHSCINFDVKDDDYKLFQNIEKEMYNFSKIQAETEKKMLRLRKWPNTENLFKDTTGCYLAFNYDATTFEAETAGPSREVEKMHKDGNVKKATETNKKIRNNDSIMTYSSYNRSPESDISTSSFENLCIDCETSRYEHKYIEKNEPQVVIQKYTKDIHSDEENEEGGAGVENELYNAIQMHETYIVQKEEVIDEIQPENYITGHENPTYLDINAYDFIEAVSKITKSLDVEREENKAEGSSCLEVLQDLNKSLCCEDPEIDDLLLKKSQVSFAALQSTKLIEMCIRKPYLATSRERIEAESILLLSGLKRDMLDEKINILDSNNESVPKRGCAKISQIRMPLIYSHEAHPNIKRYYVVIFQGGDQLFSSGVLEPNRHSYLEIGESFTFEELPADFVIKISVYSMYVELADTSNRNSATCLPFKCMKEIFTSRRPSEVLPIICWEERQPSFKLHGQCDITLAKLHKTPFTINGVPPAICLINTMECKIETAVTLTNSEKGYLNIGNYRDDGTISWRRQWCEVDGTKLKLWNEQQNEKDDTPEELNLSRCLVQWECMRKCVCQ